MPLYLIILLFFLNILFGITFFYSIFLLIFHPRKKRKLIVIPLPRGIIYLFKDKIVDKITDFFHSYLEVNRAEFETSKSSEMARDISNKAVKFVNENAKLLPSFLKSRIISFLENVIYHFAMELSCSFLPQMIDRYLIKERIIQLFSDNNIIFIERKAKYYLTKPIVIFGGVFGLIFALFNLILLIIFSIL